MAKRCLDLGSARSELIVEMHVAPGLFDRGYAVVENFIDRRLGPRLTGAALQLAQLAAAPRPAERSGID